MTAALCVACVSLVVALIFALRAVRQLRVRVILLLMRNGRWWRGRELVEASEGSVPRHAIYVVLHVLEDLGFVESRYASPRTVDERLGIQPREYRRIGPVPS